LLSTAYTCRLSVSMVTIFLPERCAGLASASSPQRLRCFGPHICWRGNVSTPRQAWSCVYIHHPIVERLTFQRPSGIIKFNRYSRSSHLKTCFYFSVVSKTCSLVLFRSSLFSWPLLLLPMPLAREFCASGPRATANEILPRDEQQLLSTTFWMRNGKEPYFLYLTLVYCTEGFCRPALTSIVFRIRTARCRKCLRTLN
jgi:hypothetical protein